jgi:hypothetical protein
MNALNKKVDVNIIPLGSYEFIIGMVLEIWFRKLVIIDVNPLEKFEIHRDVVDIDGELVFIDEVVDVSRCVGCI